MLLRRKAIDGKGWMFVPTPACGCVSLCPCSVVMGLETKELEESRLSDVSSGNKTKLQDEKEFVEISVRRKDLKDAPAQSFRAGRLPSEKASSQQPDSIC